MKVLEKRRVSVRQREEEKEQRRRYSRVVRWVNRIRLDSESETECSWTMAAAQSDSGISLDERTREEEKGVISLGCLQLKRGASTVTGSEAGDGERQGKDELSVSSGETGDGGGGRKAPRLQYQLIDFSPSALDCVGRGVPAEKRNRFTRIGQESGLAFKMVRSDTKLIRTLLHAYGFLQCSSRNPSFNVLWTGAHLRAHNLRQLMPWQRVNHFPRSNELTRKDRLYENIARAAARGGGGAYDFIPEFYVTPQQMSRLEEAMYSGGKRSGSFIVKPVSASRGRGIFFAHKPSDIPLSSPLLVSRYIADPLLVHDLKFDLRVYVAVTSFHPLVAYVYSEGLTRFASQPYSSSTCLSMDGQPDEYAHLTNYSVNKNSDKFVRNETFSSEDFGHKWTLGALLRHLDKQGKDTGLLMIRIEDLIIKSLLAVQGSVSAVCRSTLQHVGSCFELFGFDVLVDESMKPWLLEVNLSPSLSIDAPLDGVVKTRLICDLLTLACVPIVNRKSGGGGGGGEKRERKESDLEEDDVVVEKEKRQSGVAVSALSSGRNKRWIGKRATVSPTTPTSYLSNRPSTAYETRARSLLRRLRVEEGRQGGFVRVFPRHNTWHMYSPIMENCGTERWDERLYRDEYGGVVCVERDMDGKEEGEREEEQRTIIKAHQEMMDCAKFPTWSSLSAETRRLMQPAMEGTERYRERITKEGETYMARLPTVRDSARLRTKSCSEYYELRALNREEERNRDREMCMTADDKENMRV